jgi:hypothetical protein
VPHGMLQSLHRMACTFARKIAQIDGIVVTVRRIDVVAPLRDVERCVRFQTTGPLAATLGTGSSRSRERPELSLIFR